MTHDDLDATGQRDRLISRGGRGLSALPAAAIRLLVEAIETVSRELGRTVPPQRGAPFYGIDYAPGDLSPLDVLCSRGIFRKYEHALHIGAGLGAPARWWASHFGCGVQGIDRSADLAEAASRLTRRAGLSAQVRFLAADAAALPLRDRYFTHVWAGDALRLVPDSLQALREAWRVLRPGAHFALRASVGEPAAPSGRCWRERLAAAGFVDIDSQPAARPRLSQAVLLARRRLERWLVESSDPLAAQLARACAVAYERAAIDDAVALVFARRPA